MNSFPFAKSAYYFSSLMKNKMGSLYHVSWYPWRRTHMQGHLSLREYLAKRNKNHHLIYYASQLTISARCSIVCKYFQKEIKEAHATVAQLELTFGRTRPQPSGLRKAPQAPGTICVPNFQSQNPTKLITDQTICACQLPSLCYSLAKEGQEEV